MAEHIQSELSQFGDEHVRRDEETAHATRTTRVILVVVRERTA